MRSSLRILETGVTVIEVTTVMANGLCALLRIKVIVEAPCHCSLGVVRGDFLHFCKTRSNVVGSKSTFTSVTPPPFEAIRCRPSHLR
jgi:hypothetical protein